ncbi:hypothetical protein DF268_08780 [Streptomyces sp. V2]|uniref:hypothetical protein n=1 Tax=Streptomyces sp. V2 TaxID=1424099 RepID=UPI000D670AD0|nr:hypothetical protein [Streptomyces sp. V2]PWG13949.1 hypothetical protein DF268_08780 [Streptomyces sp. V2]
MSAPLVVNTTDNVVWVLRADAIRDGQALYAPEPWPQMPVRLMATYAELEAHGIAGVAYALPMPVGDAAEVFVPRTERSYWVAIADALNAAADAGMPVGVDPDGTLTDHRMWSVVWDRPAERWTVAGYDGEPDGIDRLIAPTQALQLEDGVEMGGAS